jgi:hypothetical protein
MFDIFLYIISLEGTNPVGHFRSWGLLICRYPVEAYLWFLLKSYVLQLLKQQNWIAKKLVCWRNSILKTQYPIQPTIILNAKRIENPGMIGEEMIRKF